MVVSLSTTIDGAHDMGKAFAVFLSGQLTTQARRQGPMCFVGCNPYQAGTSVELFEAWYAGFASAWTN